MSMIKSSLTTFGGWLNWECDWTILSANVPIFLGKFERGSLRGVESLWREAIG